MIEKYPFAIHSDMERELPFRDKVQTLFERVDYNIQRIKDGESISVRESFKALRSCFNLLEENIVNHYKNEIYSERNIFCIRKYTKEKSEQLANQKMQYEFERELAN